MATEKKKPKPKSDHEAEPILEIGDLTPTVGFVRINGETYDMSSPDSLNLNDRARMTYDFERIDFIESKARKGKATAADDREYDKRLGDVVQIALPSLPATVFAKLRKADVQNLAIAFFARSALLSGRIPMLRALTGGRSSPGSNGSTAATT